MTGDDDDPPVPHVFVRASRWSLADLEAARAAAVALPPEVRVPPSPSPPADISATEIPPPMIPTEQQLIDAQNAINTQYPNLDRIAKGERVDVKLTAENLATLASALGVTAIAARASRAGYTPSPSQVGWAAIIDAALVARGAPHLDRTVVETLERCQVDELERMAELVLEAGLWPNADTPETVAAKAKTARAALDAFRDGPHPAATFSPEVEPRGSKGAR